jgi:dolichyl-phosphate beta-glucosyltransferase
MSRSNIIVPLYNEEERAALFLNELMRFCTSYPGSFLVTLVNDGSTDNTLTLLQSYRANNNFVEIISYSENKGKGYAVKKAVLETTEEYAIFIDADGSISPEEITKVLLKLKEYDVVVGSRAIKGSDVTQPIYRKLVGVTFNILVNLIVRTGLDDNLCGLKGFRRAAAVKLFKQLKTERWTFDVEILYRIKHSNFSLYEMPIYWIHKPGTKFKFYDPLFMLFNLIILRFRLLFE